MWGAIGDAVLGIGSAAFGGSIDRHFDKKARADDYDFLASKGLTPQEIVGGSSGGSRGSSASSVLGNQAAQYAQQKRAQDYDERQRELDRAVQLRAQDTSVANTQTAAAASLGSSSMSAGASRYSSDNSRAVAEMNNALARDTYNNITLPDALRRSVTESPGWKRVQIMASMGVDNILGTAIAQKYGVDPMSGDALSRMSRTQFAEMVSEIYGIQSNIFGETAGAAAIVTNGINSALGR